MSCVARFAARLAVISAARSAVGFVVRSVARSAARFVVRSLSGCQRYYKRAFRRACRASMDALRAGALGG